jgi:hypothetical protein
MCNEFEEEFNKGTDIWYKSKDINDEIRKIEEEDIELWKLKNIMAEEQNRIQNKLI